MKKIMTIPILLILIFSNQSISQYKDLWEAFDKGEKRVARVVYAIMETNAKALWFGTEDGVFIFYRQAKWDTIKTTNSGLIHNCVHAICESGDGSIWLGTAGGVSKKNYNGIWESFTRDDFKLASDKVNAIFKASDGAIWFGTDAGACRYLNGTFEPLLTTSDGVAVFAICDSHDGTIWFGTDNGVYRYQNGTLPPITTIEGLANNHVYAICESRDSTMWFGTVSGVSRYKNGTFLPPITINEGLVNDNVNAIFESKDGSIWFGTDGGVSKRNPDRSWKSITRAESKLVSDKVNVIYESIYGITWFGTNEGVSGCREFWWRNFIYPDDSLADNTIHTICEANDGTLWFGTYGKGVSRYQEGKWTNFNRSNTGNELVDNYVNVIYKSSDNTLWFGTDKGVSYYKNGDWDIVNQMANVRVNAIHESGDGALWFGTAAGAISYQNGNWTTYTAAGLADRGVIAIGASGDGAMWFGTPARGAVRFLDSRWDSFLMDAIGNSTVGAILAIYRSKDGTLWLGTEKAGAIRFDGTVVTGSLDVSKGLASNRVAAICESGDGSLWLGCSSRDGGVSRYHDGRLMTFTTDQGLWSNDITAVCESSNWFLWFGTNGEGVSRFIPDIYPPFTNIFFGIPNNTLIGTNTLVFNFGGEDNRSVEGEVLCAYDVKDSNGIVVRGDSLNYFINNAVQIELFDNGTYTFSVRAKDKWGNIDPKPATRTFSIDLNQPNTIIECPRNNDEISDIIIIGGTVFDNSPIGDFDYYSIFYGKGQEPADVEKWYTLVDSVRDRRSIRSDSLATWDTRGLRGPYQLKLFAKDTLEHTSEDIITVYIMDVIGKIINREGGHVRDVGNNIEVYFPPNSFDHDMEIKIKRVPDLYIVDRDKDLYRYANLAFDILPDDIIPKKPGTLSVIYADSNLTNVANEQMLGLYHRDGEDQWRLIGGTVDLNHRKIATSITQFGGYALFENLEKGTESTLSDFDVQPRIFSPQGGGFDTQTAISFMLGKEANVTIMIYNMAGRLVRSLIINESMYYGHNVLHWDGKDKQGKFCPSGMYLVTIQAFDKVKTMTVGILDKK